MAKYIVVHSIKVATEFVPETFGRLTTIGPAFLCGSGTAAKQVCVCVCGGVTVPRKSSLRKGATQSCGCLQKERVREANTTHGHTVRGNVSDEYHIWQAMKNRCGNKNFVDYKDYGGRGIGVFADWGRAKGGFETWLAYMGPRPSESHSIDRFPDPDGNYEPGNVRWATIDEQSNNKRNTINLTVDGVTKSLTIWCRELGVNKDMVLYRVKAGWTHHDALHLPSDRRRQGYKKAKD